MAEPSEFVRKPTDKTVCLVFGGAGDVLGAAPPHASLFWLFRNDRHNAQHAHLQGQASQPRPAEVSLCRRGVLLVASILGTHKNSLKGGDGGLPKINKHAGRGANADKFDVLVMLDLPAWPRLPGLDPGRGHCPGRATTRPPSDPFRAAAAHLWRSPGAGVLLALADAPALDQSNLLLHPHPQLDPLPGRALLSHHHDTAAAAAAARRPGSVPSATTNVGSVKSACVRRLHAMAVYAAAAAERSWLWRARCRRSQELRLRRYRAWRPFRGQRVDVQQVLQPVWYV